MKKVLKIKKSLAKMTKKGFRGYPIATVAFYGPTNKVATKVVVGIVRSQRAEVDPMHKWFCTTEIRNDEGILQEVLDFMKEFNACSVIMMDRIIGCPHQEIIDYPEGSVCPECPYWAGRDRFKD